MALDNVALQPRDKVASIRAGQTRLDVEVYTLLHAFLYLNSILRQSIRVNSRLSSFQLLTWSSTEELFINFEPLCSTVITSESQGIRS